MSIKGYNKITQNVKLKPAVIKPTRNASKRKERIGVGRGGGGGRG